MKKQQLKKLENKQKQAYSEEELAQGELLSFTAFRLRDKLKLTSG